ncbi:MAG: hypothetical protein M3521_03370 [Acidobacteriota bacterium]|jgi:hypothetical protein|nr:hypothetical protein [Acidobacteriota bacterium]MDQ3372914.1 hypothetical protein [Acidobacteriota bacterium]
MGELIIEVPQNINLKFSVKSAEVVDEILRLVKKPRELKTIQVNYPYDMDEVDASEALGIWADRRETADEIARTIRDKNNGKI